MISGFACCVIALVILGGVTACDRDIVHGFDSDEVLCVTFFVLDFIDSRLDELPTPVVFPN